MFSLDLRWLAVMRIFLGLAILRDLSIIASTFSGLFGAESILPTSLALSNYFEQNYRSIHTLSGAHRWQLFLLVLQIIIAICFTLGRKTKYTAPLLWFLICSQQGANPLIINGWDSIARLLVLWCCFLPVAKVWSIDALQAQEKIEDYRIQNIATFGLILQMCHIYFRSYFLKTDPIRRIDHTATYYALSLDPFVKSFWLRVYQFPQLMKRITIYTIKLELRWPLLYLMPNTYTKILLCFAFIGFHLGLTATMYLGAFPRYAIAWWIGLLPSLFWDSKLVQSIQYNFESRKSKIPLHIKSYLFPPDKGDPRREGVCQQLMATNSQEPRANNYLSRPTKLFLIFVIAYCFLRNLRTINFNYRDDYFPASVNRFGFLLRLDQYRAMFAPYPKIDDGWYNITGITEFNGERVNITHPDRPPFDSKPTHTEIATIVTHEKRRKLVDNLRQKSNSQYREYFAQYLCRTYNATATKYTRVKSINLTYMQENTKLDYQTDPVVPVDLGTRECGK